MTKHATRTVPATPFTLRASPVVGRAPVYAMREGGAPGGITRPVFAPVCVEAGAALRATREQRGLDLYATARALLLQASELSHLERGELHLFPDAEAGVPDYAEYVRAAQWIEEFARSREVA